MHGSRVRVVTIHGLDVAAGVGCCGLRGGLRVRQLVLAGRVGEEVLSANIPHAPRHACWLEPCCTFVHVEAHRKPSASPVVTNFGPLTQVCLYCQAASRQRAINACPCPCHPVQRLYMAGWRTSTASCSASHSPYAARGPRQRRGRIDFRRRRSNHVEGLRGASAVPKSVQLLAYFLLTASLHCSGCTQPLEG